MILMNWLLLSVQRIGVLVKKYLPDRYLAIWPDQQAITIPLNDSTVRSESNVSFAEQGYL
ncbi:hypothetical protein D3C84_1259410 [compost metagenome]